MELAESSIEQAGMYWTLRYPLNKNDTKNILLQMNDCLAVFFIILTKIPWPSMDLPILSENCICQ